MSGAQVALQVTQRVRSLREASQSPSSILFLFFFRIILEPISFSQRSSENSLDMLFVWSQPEHEVWIVQMEITEQNGHVGLSEHFLEDTLET